MTLPPVTHDSAIEYRLAGVFREHRINKGLHQKDIAERVGVNAATICQWETEMNRPSRISLWVKWARALGLDFCDELRKAVEGER